ncbi:MAG TPA: hypothetical protein VFB12_05715 [Ktedonobacteraceae bacterium]|nr:hypothetical protein [Ktedonobacteraceae bacterium]
MFKHPYPAAETFRRMTDALGGVEHVRQIELPDHPTIYLFEVQRHERGPLFVVWERRDAFSGEDEPPVTFEWPWQAPQAKAIDVFGQMVPTEINAGRLSISLSLTPVFITA